MVYKSKEGKPIPKKMVGWDTEVDYEFSKHDEDFVFDSKLWGLRIKRIKELIRERA